MRRMHKFIKTGLYSFGAIRPGIKHGSSANVENIWSKVTNHNLSTTSHSLLLVNKLIDNQVRKRFLASSIKRGNNEPRFEIEPRGQLLVDEDLDIKVRGLKGGQKVSISAYLCEDDKHFESIGCYVADENGDVRLRESVSSRGTYTGISSMGHFWSMVPCPGQRDGVRLVKRGVDTPLSSTLSVYDGHRDLSELTESKGQHSALCIAPIDRWYMASDVKRVEIEEGNLRGTYFIPPGPGPFPSVLDIYGTPGGLAEHRAALLASRGIATLTLAYFKYKDLPSKMSDVSLDYFLEAVDWLTNKTGNERIGVIGLSKGGEIGLLLASQTPKVAAVVNINGCGFYSVDSIKYSRGDIPFVRFDRDKFERVDGNVMFCNSYEYNESHIIPAWNGDAKILNILGEDDLCCPPDSIHLLKSLYPAHKTENCMIVSYPGAGHVIDPPYSVLCNIGYHRVFDLNMLYGGSPEQHAFAQEDMWKRTLKFLHEELKVKS